MSTAKPSLGLLRSLTDEHVLGALLDAPRLTRAELAARTGLSKPTVSDSVRRLEGAGVLYDTGERTSGRGRVGSYYALAEGLGRALVVSIAPEGVIAEAVDVAGRVLGRHRQPVARPARPDEITGAVRTSSAAVLAAGRGPVRQVVVSAADPVDRQSGRLVHLPDAPFLVGELSPIDVLAPLVGGGPVFVDNDVNWAAQAERAASPGLDDFAYLYLGEGLGCAVVADGRVLRGRTGLAGEVAHLIVRGPGGEAVRLTEVFAALGLRRPGAASIDTERLLAAVTGTTSEVLPAVVAAVGDVLAAVVALADPELIVVAGPWGASPVVLDAVTAAAGRLPRAVTVRGPLVSGEPALSGARTRAVADLRAAVLAVAQA